MLCYHESILLTVSKDEWDTKEDTGKSMKQALYVLRYATEATSNSKKNQAHSLRVTLVLRHQEGRHLVCQ